VIKQIAFAKNCWNAAHCCESLHNTLCALYKLPKPVLYSLDTIVKEKFPVLAARHNVFDSFDVLEEFNAGNENLAYIDNHWVQRNSS
jgi:hypothetical protein